MGAIAGVEVSVAAPDGYQLEPVAGAKLTWDPYEAVKGANAVYTDVWVSMNDSPETAAALDRATHVDLPFEQARTELLRDLGRTYRDLEDAGFLLVLTRFEVRYKRPARYDDLLTIRTTVVRTTMVRIDHHYEVLRDGLLLAEAESTLACVDREGKPQALPPALT